MDEKKIVILDLTGCRYLGELHQRIKIAFQFPDGYGENWRPFGIFSEPSVMPTRSKFLRAYLIKRI